MLAPENLRYSSDHEWIKTEADGRVRVGITDFAQDALGDIVFVELPELDADVEAGASVAEVESTKSVSDIYAPVSGRIVEVNAELNDEPEKVNSDPYGDGWLFVIELADSTQIESLMDADAYGELTKG